jgi:uncharacterized membrane protein
MNGSVVLVSVVNWLHLLATVTWIGGMTTNMLVLLPSIGEALEPPAAGKLMGTVMKRFRKVIYASIAVLAITGMIMNNFNKSYLGMMQFGNLWSVIALIKHLITLIMILLVIYAFEGLAPKVAKLAASGPSQELAALQSKQKKMAGIGFMLALIILFLTGMMTAFSATS